MFSALVLLSCNQILVPSASGLNSGPGTITGFVYNDANGNLQYDSNEAKIANWNITLSQGTILITSTLTGPSGNYSFTGIPAGTYGISASLPFPYIPTQPLNNTHLITIDNSKVPITRNFGIFKNIVPINPKRTTLDDIQSFSTEGLAFDKKGYLYNADMLDNIIQKFDKNGTLISSFGNITTTPLPSGIAIDPNTGNILVSMHVSNRIAEFNSNGKLLSYFGGGPSTANNKFNGPRGLATDAQGNIYVADANNSRIQKFDSNFNYLLTVGSRSGGLPFTYLRLPFDTKLDSHGNIFVADTVNNRTQKFDPNGNFLWSIGKPGAPPGQAGVADGQFTRPRAITIGPNDNLYVADTYNSRIQVFDNNGNFLMKFGSTGFGPGQFLYPAGVVVDNSTGNIFVADYGNNRIQVFNSHGSFLYQFPSRPAVMEPYFGYIDNKGRLFESDGTSNYVIAFNTTTGSFISQFGGFGVGAGQLSGPRGIATDSAGNFWVADNYNHRIVKFDPTGKFLQSVGSFGSGPGQFNQPRGLVIDSLGNILVADTQNSRVQRFDSNGHFLASYSTPNMGGAAIYYIALDKQNNIYVAENANDKIEKLAPNGTSLMVFGSPGSLPGQFINDKGVYVDSNGNIYVADSTNNRIQKFDSQGNFIFQFGKIGTGPGQLHNPRDVVDDNGGNLWVSDTDNHRIQEFDKNGNYIKQIVYAQPAFTVSASPSSGTYSTIPTITLTSSRTPSTIFYTTDGTTPTISSPSGPSPVIVAVNTNSTLKFFAKDSFGNTSPTSIAVYTIFNSSIIIQMNDTVSSMGLNVYKDNQTQDEIASPTSQLVGKSIDTIVVDLKKTGLPSGPVQVGVFTNTLSVKKLFGTIDASALTSSFKTYSFSLTPAQSYKIQAGDRIGIKFTGGDSSNKVVIMEDATNSFDGMNSYLITYDTAWQYHNFRDLYMILSLHQH